VGLNQRHRAVTLLDKDGQINCPGGGQLHAMRANGTLLSEGHALFYCETCKQNIFLLRARHGVIDTWQVEPHEVSAMIRLTEARSILEYLNRGAKRLDRI
jgi:hypothetical protein